MTNSDFIEQTRLLVARTQQGDHKSFAQLYDMYVNQLFNFGLRLTTDRELLKDCIHDVFVKIYVKREELSEVVNFRSYLFISLKNRICDELRRLVFGSDVQVDSLQRVSRLRGPSAEIAVAGLIDPVKTTGFSVLRVRFRKKAVSSMVSVPWVITNP